MSHNDPARAGEFPPDAGNASNSKRSVRFWLGLAVGLCLLTVIGRFVLGNPDPVELAQRGHQLMDRKPNEAESLFRQAIEVSDDAIPMAEAPLCLLLTRKDEWDESLSLYRDLKPGDCPDEFLMEFGRRAHKAGHVTQAIDALNVVRRRKSKTSLTALELLGQIHHDRHEDREMLSCVKEMALLDRTAPLLWWRLVELTDQRHLKTESISHLQLALMQSLPSRDLLEMRHQLIARLVEQGRIDEAENELNQLPQLEQSSARTERHRAALYRLEGKPDQALAALEAAQSLTVDHPGTAWLRGQIRFDLGQWEDAVRDFQMVLSADAYDLTVHLKIAEALRQTNQTDAALAHEETARTIREKRQRINKLKEVVMRGPADRADILELVGLCRELNDHRAADYWQKQADAADAPNGR